MILIWIFFSFLNTVAECQSMKILEYHYEIIPVIHKLSINAVLQHENQCVFMYQYDMAVYYIL